jgi:hypothetical protein
VVDVVTPPDPVIPNENGVINRLEAMDNQLQLLNGFFIAVMLEVVPPDPVVPPDVVPALVSVGETAQGIVDIDAFPPDPILPVFDEVKNSAQTIVNNVTEYLGLSDCGVCSSYTDPLDCQAVAECFWVMPDPGEPFCCDQ